VGRAGAATRRTLGDSEGQQGTTKIEVSSGLQPFTWAANPLDWAFTQQRSQSPVRLFYTIIKASLRAAACGGRPRPAGW
jgi:hypothetical protein